MSFEDGILSFTLTKADETELALSIILPEEFPRGEFLLNLPDGDVKIYEPRAPSKPKKKKKNKDKKRKGKEKEKEREKSPKRKGSGDGDKEGNEAATTTTGPGQLLQVFQMICRGNL